ncbi:hypothetical protein [Myceligenerans crystallogenes]|uniref:ApeI dehydratase-like domain-containing protein n=1 Tax=Myceligenerans crystallogenes TaxID=316335 RepID=A0ABP4ZPM0_9MICO
MTTAPAEVVTRLAGAGLTREAGPDDAAGGTERYSAVLPVGHPALAGHYPGYPIVPGVFLVEIAASAEAFRLGVPELGDRWTGVPSVRFRAPVFPGQRILLDRTERRGRPRYALSHEDGTAVATVDLDVAGEAREPGGPAEAAAPPASSAPSADYPRPEEILPHRPPMLLLDRVESVEPGAAVTATYTVTAGAGGATPDGAAGAMPWPLVVESWAQAAAMLTTWHEPTPDVRTGSVLLFGGAREVTFGAPAPAGTTLTHEVTLVADSGGAAVLSGSSRAGDREVLRVGQLTIGRRPASELPDPGQARNAANAGGTADAANTANTAQDENQEVAR